MLDSLPVLSLFFVPMLSGESELRALRDELSAIIANITGFQVRLAEALSRTEEATQTLQLKVNGLEAAKRTASSEVRKLQAQNEELHKVLEAKKPDISRALEARDAAVQKLERARKVIRDISEERRAGTYSPPILASLSSGPSGLSQCAYKASLASPIRASVEVVSASESNSVESDEDDGSTVRPSAPSVSASVERTVSPTRSTSSDETKVARSPSPREATSKTRQQAFTHKLHAAITAVSEASKPRNQRPRYGPSGWYLQYSKPPASATIASTEVLTYRALQERLKLDEETMICIDSLEWMQRPCMRLHIYRNMVFLHRPIVLEVPGATYLVDWCEEAINRGIKRYLVQGTDRPADSVFHVLVNAHGLDSWTYLGAHRLTYEDPGPVWRTSMDGKARKELCSELKSRWNSSLNIQYIAHAIHEGKFEQCSIKLDSDGLQTRSIGFAREALRAAYMLLEESS